jgi:NAD(P)-dependent dehydrogenase (short-subunit alcohol dehydrogenase family)
MASTWTTDDIGDLTDQRVVITGANSGIGKEAARVLAQHGATVVVACRDLTKGEEAIADIRTTTQAGALELLQLDLADLTAVEAAAEEYRERFDRLDILINNAGVMALPYRQTVDGFEMQFGTNHLGHFALTGHLFPLLLAAPAPRVVTVSSGAHKAGRMNFDNLDGSGGYWKWPAYAQSKLANLLFTFELQRRAEAANLALEAVAAHPGYSSTNLQGAASRMTGARLAERGWNLINTLVGQSARRGALPTVYAATGSDISGGDYVGPNGPAELWGRPVKVGTTRAARDSRLAARLWTVSEELTGVVYEGLAVGA